MSSKSPAKALKAKPSKTRPDFSIEDMFDGPVCGLDEAGRGPLAGPVVAACVYIPHEMRGLDFVAHIRDSKTLSDTNLLQLDGLIRGHFFYGIAEVSPEIIDSINILQASLLAMQNAYSMIAKIGFACALVDGNRAPQMPCTTKTVVKGDSISTSIAAASIVAKVHRDKIMRQLSTEYPAYGWERNAGYPAPAHLEALSAHGVTPHHRRTYAPVRAVLEDLTAVSRLKIA
jgi:ribonuclease HII